MLIQPIADDLFHLNLHGMAEGLKSMQTDGSVATMSLIDGLGLLVSRERHSRDNRRLTRLIKQAKFRITQACIEDIDYTHPRKLDKSKMQYLIQSQWAEHNKNIIFTGATGLGKSYLACALGQYACRQGHTTRYFRVSKLLEALRLAHVDGSLSKLLVQLAKAKVLILDDWGIEPLQQQQRNWLLEIIEEGYQRQATIITTQLPVEHWHDYIGDNTIADAILDRLLACSETINLKGNPLRPSKDGPKDTKEKETLNA